MIGEQKRQGDLLIIRVAVMPEGVEPVRDLVLARGEATGHAHVLSGGQVFRAFDGALFFRADEAVRLDHDEHATLSFEPGLFMVRRQREFFESEPRVVGD